LNSGETTNYRVGDAPTACTLSGVSYTWIPIEKMSGWIASIGLEACSGSCVSITADPSTAARRNPCGATATTLARNSHHTVSSTALDTCKMGTRLYAWVDTSSGWLAADYLQQCTAAPPPPPAGCHTNTHPTTIGQAGLNMITQWEGIVNCYYIDVTGHPTICIGHLVTNGQYHPGECLTTAQCQALLKRDISSYINCVRDYITAPLNQNMFDALVDFTYNLGCGTLIDSTLRKDLNRGDYSAVCGQLKEYVYSSGVYLQGLANRRAAECNLFNSCKGINVASAYVACPTADACSSCLLNSQNDALFAYYNNIGYNITCSSANWAFLANDWCTNVNPWECYWAINGQTGVNNGTSLCGTQCPSNYIALPTIPQPNNLTSIPCINQGSLNLCTGADDCIAQLDNSTCDTLTGRCLVDTTDGYAPFDICPSSLQSGAFQIVAGFVLIALAALLLN